jgi:GNAT superfamily N-acetyltransferase
MSVAQAAPISVVRETAAPDPSVSVDLVTTGLEKDRFIKFQWQIYQGDPHWVSPLLMERHAFLDPAQNPFFEHADAALYVAVRDGRMVGRIAAIEDRNFNAFHKVKKAYFGLYESIDDPSVAASLFAAAKNWARWRGLESLIGPMNLSSNSEWGLLVDGFDSSPYLYMPYNPPYYASLFTECGLEKAKDLFAFERPAHTPPPERFSRIADKIREREGVTVRSLDLRCFDAEVERIRAIYNSAWERNWGFVPMTDAEFDKLAHDLRSILVPELVLIVEDHGKPIAFSLTVPDMNQALKQVGGRLTSHGLPIGLAKLFWYSQRIDRVRLIALGVKEGWRRRGIDAVMVVETIRRTHRLGYKGGEVSWTLEDNDLINRAIESAGCKHTKTYRVFETPVE